MLYSMMKYKKSPYSVFFFPEKLKSTSWSLQVVVQYLLSSSAISINGDFASRLCSVGVMESKSNQAHLGLNRLVGISKFSSCSLSLRIIPWKILHAAAVPITINKAGKFYWRWFGFLSYDVVFGALSIGKIKWIIQ